MSGTNVWRFLSGTFTLGVIAVGVLGACGPIRGRGEAHTAHETATLTQPLSRLVFTDFSASDISVEKSAEGTAEVTRDLRWWGDKRPRYTETWEGQTLRVSYDCDFGDCSVDYHLRVPAGVEVLAKTSSGDVSVAGITAPVAVQTTSGDVTLTGLKGRVTLKTTSGKVSTSDLAGAQADVVTTSGDVNLGYSVAPQTVSVRTTSGDCRILVPPGEPYLVSVRTTSGDHRVTVDQSQSAGRKIDIVATSGDVTISYA